MLITLSFRPLVIWGFTHLQVLVNSTQYFRKPYKGTFCVACFLLWNYHQNNKIKPREYQVSVPKSNYISFCEPVLGGPLGNKKEKERGNLSTLRDQRKQLCSTSISWLPWHQGGPETQHSSSLSPITCKCHICQYPSAAQHLLHCSVVPQEKCAGNSKSQCATTFKSALNYLIFN